MINLKFIWNLYCLKTKLINISEFQGLVNYLVNLCDTIFWGIHHGKILMLHVFTFVYVDIVHQLKYDLTKGNWGSLTRILWDYWSWLAEHHYHLVCSKQRRHLQNTFLSAGKSTSQALQIIPAHNIVLNSYAVETYLSVLWYEDFENLVFRDRLEREYKRTVSYISHRCLISS